MKKWNVCLAFGASRFVGGVEAETAEEAIEKAIDTDGYVGLCHQCSHEIDIGDPIAEESGAEEITE